jgi:hypothetical protein
VVTAAGSAWARPGGLTTVASTDVALASTAPPPRPEIVERAAPPPPPPLKTSRRGAHRANAHKAAKRDELDKVIGQKGLIDVYSPGHRGR